MFDSVDPKQSLPELERGILQYWREEDVFKRSISERSQSSGNIEYADEVKSEKGKVNSDTFSFYDGPPFATGLPHYGHLLAGTIKDVIPRYQTMKGKSVERRFGWDCHGLPIENLIEQEHNITDHKQITDDMGVRQFNQLCREAVQRYTGEWRKTVERMGRWVDMDWDYRTMDPDYMESMWWAFKQIHDHGLIYEGHKPMHICPRCVTPLSNFEVTQGYEDVTDISVTAKFELIDTPGTYVLAWTTTPWTLPGNQLLAIGNDISYAYVLFEGATYVLAEDLVETVFKDKEYEVVGTKKGKELIGQTYIPVFSYFEDQYKETAFRIVDGSDFVTTDSGTGVVHIASGFGEDDYNVSKREQIEILQHVTMHGQFTDEVTDFAGLSVKPKDDPSKTDRKIADWLQKNEKLFSQEKYKHSYPHCWRCDMPLLNYATSSWFVKVENIKEDMLQEKEKTSWVPGHLKDGRFGKWLEGARDWAISRNRFWGTPLPIWRQDSAKQNDAGEVEVVGSRDDLMTRQKLRFTKVTVVRHGESEGNLIPIYQGEVPGTDLTNNGQAQAKKAGQWIAAGQAPVDVIYCSPLARARQTAEAIAAETGAEIIVDERLKELNFGPYEGKTIDFSDQAFQKERRAHKLENSQVESIYHFAGMEPWESVQSRVQSFYEEKLPLHRSDHICVVTHADIVMNMRHFFTQVSPMNISQQPYPQLARPEQYFWDHDRNQQLDLHKDRIDDVVWMGSKSDASVELTLVRHGQTDVNVEHRTYNKGEDPGLNTKGKEQIALLAKQMEGQEFDIVISSDLQRAAESARILADALGIAVHEQWKELRERDQGDWGGRTLPDILAQHPAPYEEESTALHPATPPNGESLTDLLQRSQAVQERLLQEYPGKKVLIVSHKGIMRALQATNQNMKYQEIVRTKTENAAMVQLWLHPFMRRIPDVLDCWFESGSMPYAQSHYPFEFEHAEGSLPPGFPANFIAEGVDQCRAWFYTLMVLSVAIFGKTPYKNVVVNGIVLAEDGKKMSKRLKNYPEPTEIVEKYGADSIRWTLMSSPAVRAEDLRMSEKLVEESLRGVLLPLWNVYSFFVTYANAAAFEGVDTRHSSTHPLDQWIHAELQDLTNRMTAQLNAYDLSACCSELYDSIDALTNWYIRLSRRRFAGKTSETDQRDALHTLYDVLLTLCQLLAPFCPFVTDAIYLNLASDPHGSIHLTNWPDSKDLSKNQQLLLQKTRLMRQIVSLGNKVRRTAKVKTRQPLAKADIAVPPALHEGFNFSTEDLALLRDELNVKDLHFLDDPTSLAEVVVQVDARKVGPRLGKRVQELIQAGKAGDYTQNEDGTVLILDETLAPDEVSIVYHGKEGQDVEADRGVVVAVDTAISPELEREGQARDLIRTVQRLRKEQGFEFTDVIVLHIQDADAILNNHLDMILEETNAVYGENAGTEHRIECGDVNVVVQFEKRG